MSDLITALGSLFTFLFNQMGNMASFFTSNVLGQVILGLVIFSIITSVVVSLFNHFRK